MKYFFILGSNAPLSIYEIISVLKAEHILYSPIAISPEFLIIETEKAIDELSILKRLGGTIKIGSMIHSIGHKSRSDKSNLAAILGNLINQIPTESRRTIGLSVYQQNIEHHHYPAPKIDIHNISSILKDIKKIFKALGTPTRFILPKEDTKLSSVVVSKQGLLADGGCEVVIMVHRNQAHIGVTHGVQDFEEYSRRDFGRPQRGMDRGILPPKLAQIMINLAGLSPKNNPTILDPFCGFGTVLQEAALIGFTSIMGSDIDTKAISATKENLLWLQENTDVRLNTPAITQSDALLLSKTMAANSIDAIATEGYLGPIITNQATQEKIQETQRELSVFYKTFFKSAGAVLKNKGIVVIALPAFLINEQLTTLSIIDTLHEIGLFPCPFPEELLPLTSSRFISERNSLLYYREGQHVAREIFVLKKN